MKLLKRLAIFFGLLYLAGCAVLFFGQEFIVFHPHPLAEDHEYTFVRPFEELEFSMADGTSLNAIHFKVDSPDGVVIFWHGNTGNIQVCSPQASHFINRGYAVLMSDYRSYGKSDGKLSQETLYSDGLEVFDQVRAMYPDEKLVLYGQSLGSGVAVYTASQRELHHLILEAPYWSIEEIGKENYPFMPVSLLLKYPMRSHDYFDKVNCGITIFHGTDDEVIPQAHAKRLAALNELTKFVSLSGGGHNGCPLFQEYQDGLDEALLGYVREDQRPIDAVRKSKLSPLPVVADSLKSYFSKMPLVSDQDSLWLLYFKKFPRSHGEFLALYGDGDTTLVELLEQDAEAHLNSFFSAVTVHKQIRPADMMIDLSVGASAKKGKATDILRKYVQIYFMENDSLFIEELKSRKKREKQAFWTFYLEDLLVTPEVRENLLDRLNRDIAQKKIVEALLPEEEEMIEELIADTLLPDTLAIDSVMTEIDTLIEE